MRKRLLALFMALVMVFGLNTVYLADGDSPVGDNTAEVKEIEVVWEKTESGQNSWNARIKCDTEILNTSLSYNVKLYNEKKEVVATAYRSIYNIETNPGIEYLVYDFTDDIEEEGEGKYSVGVEMTSFNWETKETKVIGRGESEVAEYKAPEAQLATNASVTNGVLTFDKVEGASSYIVRVTETWYSVTANEYRESIYEEMDVDEYFLEEFGKYFTVVNGGQSLTYDFAKAYEDMQLYLEEWYEESGIGTYERTEHDFNLYVQAKTYDINEVRSSELKKAGEYDIRLSSEQIADKLEALTPEKIKEKPVNAKNQIEDLSKDTLVELMKDTAFVEKVALIEDALLNMENSKYLKPTADSTSALIDKTKISIIGALMNVGEGVQTTLSVADAKDVTAPAGYFNAVALDIKLLAGEDELKDLRIPVEITMPIPAGVSTENLVILHYHDGATEPVIITPVASADGKMMTFVVDGFSTFVVANQGASVTSPITGDMFATSMVCAILVLAVGVVVFVKRRSMVK